MNRIRSRKPKLVRDPTFTSIGELRVKTRTVENALGLRKPHSVALVPWITFFSLSLAFGCERIVGRSVETDLVAPFWKEGSSQETMVVDLGILFADREQILCIPVAKLGITRADQIRSIVSSCDCILAKALEYTESTGQAAVALEILHAKTTFRQVPAMRLTVQLAIDTTSNNRKCVELICTVAREGNRE